MNTFSTTGLIVFCALLGSVFSENFCKYCHERNGTTCKNETVIECAGGRCMTISQHILFAGRKMWSFYKGCADTSLCQSGPLASHLNLDLQSYTNCCHGNCCNMDGFNIANENRTLNRRICPYCFKLETMKESKPERNIECTGSQDMCFTYRGIMMTSDGYEIKCSAKGCGNNITCTMGFDGFIGIYEIERKTMSCKKATSATP